MSAIPRLTQRQKWALVLMAKTRCAAVVSDSATRMLGEQPWIHWRTCVALWHRGLVELDDGSMLPPDEWPEEPAIRLTPRGREIASRWRLFGDERGSDA